MQSSQSLSDQIDPKSMDGLEGELEESEQLQCDTIDTFEELAVDDDITQPLISPSTADLFMPNMGPHVLTKVGFELAKEVEFSRCQNYRKGEIACRADEPVDRILFVSEGYFAVKRRCITGQEQIIRLCPPGSIIGIRYLMGQTHHRASCIALDQSKVSYLPSEQFVEKVEEQVERMRRLNHMLCEYVREIEERLSILSHTAAAHRLALTLSELVNYHSIRLDDGHHVLFPVHRHLLAELSGIREETVSRLATTFREKGWISWGKSSMVIHEPEELLKL